MTMIQARTSRRSLSECSSVVCAWGRYANHPVSREELKKVEASKKR